MSSIESETQPKGNIHVVPFAVAPVENQNIDGIENGRGIVGNIIFFGNSAYVWASWGKIIKGKKEVETPYREQSSPIIGKGLPLMGPLGLAMPRKRYAGMHSDVPSYTQLIGGSSDEDMILGSGMACRLSDKVGCPVFVSLNVAGGEEGESMTISGTLEENIRMTVAMIEREVTSILMENKRLPYEV